jgi:multidrug resistance efflux pump
MNFKLLRKFNFRRKFNFKKFMSSARAWVLFILSIVIIIIIYFIFADIYTPYTGDAYIQAYVVQVASQVEGRVTDICVLNNTFVKKGERLFSIDQRPFKYKVERLQAKLVQAKKQIAQLEREIEAAQAVVERQQADVIYAKKRYGEALELVKEELIAQTKLDRATDILSSKIASLNQAQADLHKAQEILAAKIGGEYALIKEVQAELALAKYDLSESTVYAPEDGYVTNLQLSVGAYVKVGQPALTFVDTHKWWIVANFRENSLERIRPGQGAELSIATYPGKIFPGKVESVEWGVSVGQGIPSGVLPQVKNQQDWVKLAQRFPVRLRLVNHDSRYPLRIGGSASVAIFTARGWFFNNLARLWLRIGTYLDYIY